MNAALFELFFYGSILIVFAAVLGIIQFVLEKKDENK